MPTEPEEKFEMWAKVDLFGHNIRAGKLSVVNTGVEVLYRLDSPDGNGFVTEYFGKGAVYSILPCSEEVARLMSERLGTPAPVSMWDLPEEWRAAIRSLKEKALPAPKEQGGDFESERTYTERMEEHLNDDERPEEDREYDPDEEYPEDEEEDEHTGMRNEADVREAEMRDDKDRREDDWQHEDSYFNAH